MKKKIKKKKFEKKIILDFFEKKKKLNLKFRSTRLRFWDKSQSLNLRFFLKKNKKIIILKKKIFLRLFRKKRQKNYWQKNIQDTSLSIYNYNEICFMQLCCDFWTNMFNQHLLRAFLAKKNHKKVHQRCSIFILSFHNKNKK